MCEPAHSIVQADLNKVSAAQEEWLITTAHASIIDGFAHLSYLGHGHSQALDKLRRKLGPIEFVTFDYNDWDGNWWSGDLKLGFTCMGIISTARKHSVANIAAQEYHNRVCVGNQKIFRRFIEGTLQFTQHPLVYVWKLQDILTPYIYSTMVAKIPEIQKVREDRFGICCSKLQGKISKKKIITTVMPFLRQRRNFRSDFLRQHSWGTAS